MDLQRNCSRICTVVQIFQILLLFFGSFLLTIQPVAAQSASQRPPALIRDTDTAEGKEITDASTPKEPDPILSEQNLNIGNFYYKQKNYAAAISRYLEAIAYQPDSIRAYDALTRAYEKNDQPDKAIAAYKQFIGKNPNSPKTAEFLARLAKLEKK
jgi:tetratricopeptide (TPR) repeat protein